MKSAKKAQGKLLQGGHQQGHAVLHWKCVGELCLCCHGWILFCATPTLSL